MFGLLQIHTQSSPVYMRDKYIKISKCEVFIRYKLNNLYVKMLHVSEGFQRQMNYSHGDGNPGRGRSSSIGK